MAYEIFNIFNYSSFSSSDMRVLESDVKNLLQTFSPYSLKLFHLSKPKKICEEK